jgi:O-acetyl-ADP-ribose deacetylase (regulator of RNase III)
MVVVKIVNGNLLDADEKYICQQCNCNTIKPHGLSKAISDRYIWGNPYNTRTKKGNNSTTTPDEPGTVVILENSNNTSDKIILCLMAQWLPGKPGYYNKYKCYENTYDDTYLNRRKWFQECLDIIDEDNEIDNIAMPYNIGCGLAGGCWNDYKEMLENCKTNITLYKI